MWLSIWLITVASAIGLAVIAMTALPKDQRATFGGCVHSCCVAC